MCTPAMGSLSSYLVQRLLLLLLCLLLRLNSSLAYSLKSCTISYSKDASADVFVECTSNRLVAVPDDIPRDVNTLHLEYNLIERINREDFGNFSKLRILHLSSNRIAHVEDGSFIHLVSLTWLFMGSNKLTKLTSNLFQGLSNLTTLDLSLNNIKFIHPSAFQFLSSLQSVHLDSNKLQQITDIQPIIQLPHLQNLSIKLTRFLSFETKDLLPNVTSTLKVLDVSNNNFKRFSITTKIFPYLEMIDISQNAPAEAFTWDIPDKTLLSNITQLDLSFARISFKEIQKVLQSLDSLMHLRLNNMEEWIDKGLLTTVCKIPTLRKLDLLNEYPGNLSAKFVNCTQLTELDLSVTHMTELSKGSIRQMKQLRFLDLHKNRLTIVPDDIRSLSFLKILHLSGNRITDLGCNDFINTTRLTELDLSCNRIIKLEACVFKNLNDLKLLDMSMNLLFTFGDTFKLDLQMLEFLDLSNNYISFLEKGDFQGLTSLKYLYVQSKYISRVKDEAFDGLTNLGTLTVSFPFEIENDFRGLQQLENLTVYYYFLENIVKSPVPNYNESFLHLQSLKVFTMIFKGNHAGFPFKIPPELHQAMKNLEEFKAENLYISAPDLDTFQYNPQLKSLTIGKSDLSDLGPELFKPIPNLQALELYETKLKSLDFLFQANLDALRYLKLSDNEITLINETVFQYLPALTYLDLDNNPFTCDCSNAGFIQWVKSNNKAQVANGYKYTCSFPAAQQGTKLLDFDIQSCWINVRFLCFICSTCLVVSTLLTSFIYHFLRWQLAYTFQLFLAFLYDSRKRKKGAPHVYDAFVSYNVHDEAWVYREMLPELEEGQGWKLCLHHRDFQPGKPIVENITDAIYGSRKTICVISRRYLQSEWCSREIQMASFRLFDEQKDVLILLFLEEIPARQLSPYYRMRKLVKKRTYLSWPQAGQHTGVFWQNVGRALDTGDADNTDLLTGPAGC